MAPILIDNRGLKKLVFISGLTTVLVFSGGFLTGYQQATGFYQAGSELESLFLPEKVISVENDIKPQPPETVDAGEEIDVDQPKSLTQAVTRPVAQTIEPANLASGEQVIKVNNTTTNENIKSVKAIKNNKNKGDKFSIKEKVASINSLNQNNSITAKKAQPVLALAFTTDELSKIKYSIQVGAYSRLINAENMKKMLQAQHLDAYISDYINRKNEIRYNVRFGYFVAKKAAVTALEEYKDSQKSDGYLVKISVKNMTKLAAAENTKVPVTIEQTDKDLSPKKIASENLQDKLSEADVINTSNVLTKLQSTSIIN